MVFKITDIFKSEELKLKSDGNYQTECPSCGLQGGRTEGFILFVDSNTAFCHSSQKHFNALEVFALKNKLITCIEGRGSGEKGSVLKGKLFYDVLDLAKETFTDEQYIDLAKFLHIRIRAKIKIPGFNRYISDFCRELGGIMADKNIMFYHRDGKRLVEIDARGKDSNFLSVTNNKFVTLIETYAAPYFETVKKKKGEASEIKEINISIQGDIAAKTIVSNDFLDNIPVIKRIFNVQTPCIYEGKITFPVIGYDPRFCSWVSFNAPKISKPNMSLDEAKKVIGDLFKDFCFLEEQDRVCAFAAFISPGIRGLYSDFNVRSPLTIYRGNRERVGKDYCAGITGIVFEGEAVETAPISVKRNNNGGDDEVKKKITAFLMSGRKRFHSSNNKGKIDNSVFESILTSTVVTDRILGKNDIEVKLPNEMEYSLSANMGTAISPDLEKRSNIVNFFYQQDDINSRVFSKTNLHGYVLENRELILSAVFALIRNWEDKGCKPGSLAFSSFPDWARICGGIMEAAGYSNPCNEKKKKLSTAIDPETDEMRQFYEFMFEKQPNAWLTKNEMISILKDENADIFAWLDFDKLSDKTKFAMKVESFGGRDLKTSTYHIKMEEHEDNVKNRGNKRKFRFILLVKKEVKDEEVEDEVVVEEVEDEVGKEVVEDEVVDEVVKNSRDAQFWETEECEEIKSVLTSEQVLDWIKTNPNKTADQVNEALGLGSYKFITLLQVEGKIKEVKNILEVIENV